MKSIFLAATVVLIASFSAGPIAAQVIGKPVHLDTFDQPINSVTAARQWVKPVVGRSVSPLPGGGFVATWMSDHQTASGLDLFARRFRANGTPIDATDIQVNAWISGHQMHPVVATTEGGGFVVAWFGARDGDQSDILVRRFSLGGIALDATDIRANTSGGHQSMASIAALSGGGFVVAWQGNGPGAGISGGIFFRRFRADGTAIDAEEKQVNVVTSNGLWAPDVALLTGGNFVVTWMSLGQDGSGWGIFARRFSAEGVAIDASDIPVNTEVEGDQIYSSVAALPGGAFVVAWDSANQDGSGKGVYARRFSADGNAIDAADIPVNADPLLDQHSPTVTSGADGSFVVAWTYGPEAGVYLRRFGADGVARDAADFRINRTVVGPQAYPSIAMLADGNTAVVVWEGRGLGDGNGVFSQRVRLQGPPVARGNVATVAPGGTVTIAALANDADPDAGDTLRIVRAMVDMGTVAIQARRRLVYTAPASGATSARIVYAIRDASGHRARGTVEVSIAP